jgi:uncharacterized membrane protein (DUF106 family)
MESYFTIDNLLKALGVFTVMAAGIKAIIYLLTPVTSTKKKLDEHEQKLKDHEEYLENDKESIENLTEMSKDIMRLQLSLLNHAIDGNGIEKIKELRDDIQQKII